MFLNVFSVNIGYWKIPRMMQYEGQRISLRKVFFHNILENHTLRNANCLQNVTKAS